MNIMKCIKSYPNYHHSFQTIFAIFSSIAFHAIDAVGAIFTICSSPSWYTIDTWFTWDAISSI